jgi:prepilin-type N-terminal cleavage/methylation domain-containing protein
MRYDSTDRPRWRQTLGAIICGVPVTLIALAGVLKLADLPGFEDVVRGWKIVPSLLAPAVAIVLPVVEIWIGGSWLLGVRRAQMAWAAVLLLIAVSTVFIVQVSMYGNTNCGCFGLLTRRFHETERAQAVLLRNVALIAAIVTGIGIQRRRADAEGSGKTRALFRSGFTLIETLVCLVVIGVLLAIAIPSLTSVRHNSRVSATLSNLRQHGAILHSYSADWSDTLPYLGKRGEARVVIRCKAADIEMTTGYFQTASFWWLALCDDYYDGTWNSRVHASPLGDGVLGSYVLSCAGLADPKYFEAESRFAPPEQLRPVRFSEVVFPGKKSLVIDQSVVAFVDRQAIVGQMVQLGLCDGSAMNARVARLKAQYGLGDGPYFEYGAHHPAIVPATHTVSGVRGRDLQ